MTQRADRIVGDKMLKMARAFAGNGKRRNPKHSFRRGFIAGLELALMLDDDAAIAGRLAEEKAKLARSNRLGDHTQ